MGKSLCGSVRHCLSTVRHLKAMCGAYVFPYGAWSVRRPVCAPFGSSRSRSGREVLEFNQAWWFACASWRALGRRREALARLSFPVLEPYCHVKIVHGALARRARQNLESAHTIALEPGSRNNIWHGGLLPPSYRWQRPW
jgi:hypothetical protein